MADRPILFSGPMVQGIRAGRKTQTRRVKNIPQGAIRAWLDGMVWKFWLPDGLKAVRCPYGQPGDRLWVRETWAPFDPKNPKCRIVYRADMVSFGVCASDWAKVMPTQHPQGAKFNWKPSIHMPRRNSRLTLEVTEVRVQRLQEISAADCCHEGILLNCASCTDECGHLDQMPNLQRQVSRDFQKLWGSINGKTLPWSSNPWVWAISFRRLP
jgi:hypothetical protein